MSGWMDMPELAEHLGVGLSTVQRKVAAREWPHRRPAPRAVRFSPEDVRRIEQMTAVEPVSVGRIRRAS